MNAVGIAHKRRAPAVETQLDNEIRLATITERLVWNVMARTREFDTREALSKAMSVFWEKGYTATSIDDLVTATGVSRYGLYGEFENKHGLFLASLDLYQEEITWKHFAGIERTGAGVKEVREFFKGLESVSASKMGRLGCLMTNSSAEIAPMDDVVSAKIRRFRQRLQKGFRTAIGASKAAGEVRSDLDVDQAADLLTAIMFSIGILARSGANAEMIGNVASAALKSIE